MAAPSIEEPSAGGGRHQAILDGPGLGAERWVGRACLADVSAEGFSGPLWSARAEARDWLHRSVSGVGYPASTLLEALLLGVRQDVALTIRPTGTQGVLEIAAGQVDTPGGRSSVVTLEGLIQTDTSSLVPPLFMAIFITYR